MINRRKLGWTLQGNAEQHLKALYWKNFKEQVHQLQTSYLRSDERLDLSETFSLCVCKPGGLHLACRFPMQTYANVFFSLFQHIPCVYPSYALPDAHSCHLRQTHLTLFKSSLLTSKSITSKLQVTRNLNYFRSLLNKRWHSIGFLHRNWSHFLCKNLDPTFSRETAVQKQDFVYLAFEGCY